MLRIYLTGNAAIEDGDVLVPERRFPGRQGRLAFTVLAWQREGAMAVDELADVLWDGAPPTAWQTALRAVVSKIRTILPSTMTIEHGFGCYQLRVPADAWVDVEAAARAVHDAETALRAGDLQAGMGSSLVANAIARRPFLAGDVSAWSERKRDQLRDIRVRALEVRSRVALSLGDAVGAAADAEIVIELDPYRETACALLMRASVSTGNPGHALAAYERLRTRLAEDLGTQPSAETEAVFLDVLSAR